MFCCCRYFDDGTKARHKPPRHYAFRKQAKSIVAENRWASFLNHWSSNDLAVATSLVCAHVCADLHADEQDLLHSLRKFHDVLLLKRKDPLHAYQMRLRTLHRLGIINLSVHREDASLAQLLSRKRSLEASLRESRKRTARAEKTIDNMRAKCDSMQTNLDNCKLMLQQARANLQEFKSLHPDWTPESWELQTADHDDATKIFGIVDKDLDLAKQLKYDPSGGLTTFWAEQRKQLSREGRSRRWNAQVSIICCFDG